MNPSPDWNSAELLRSPLFAPLHPVIARLGAAFPGLPECNALLAECDPAIVVEQGHAVRFVPQEYGRLAFEAQYEPRCYLDGGVQSRADNWHDLLNALVWLTFPKAKAAINARHYHALIAPAHGPTRSQRGAVRDTNTLLDESGVIVAYVDDELAGLLRDFHWKALFWQRRERVQTRMSFHLFGHGLYEKALRPYIGMTGQGLLLPVAADFFSWPPARQLRYLDERLASYLADPEHCRSTRELSPVPLLGIPGWAEANEEEGFYENTKYFRRGRAEREVAYQTAPVSL